MNVQKLLNRLKNTGTLVAVISSLILILTTLGISVDSEKIMLLVKLFCGLGICLGVLNNPDLPGMYVPGVTDRKDNIENK